MGAQFLPYGNLDPIVDLLFSRHRQVEVQLGSRKKGLIPDIQGSEALCIETVFDEKPQVGSGDAIFDQHLHRLVEIIIAVSFALVEPRNNSLRTKWSSS